ncbi:MAG: DNA polymerase I [Paracoccus sp. (in: a-proteobacteria)]|uniref:DNA polymerase I n=1 Tax=unclassified Paracoccus (in: a-proteobacteria) TaxID=2688777 RepID=UPI000C5B6396|nr:MULTISPECIES: DNA polymerase I [unclassified Paracoccus (in: a-proteobacteria)]MAN57629.1 DNA polymerase I [Paracoccus sp. (in: a-proteobacteria)]MBA49108.1 DNA polymerase I [Paracoccus sp. (in: a-proteobacteria)]MDB2490329.1 DNA polymerase I [Paracoccus sp. (in: a-proteobacteria)]MDB2551792.1 DNA polymerase I [Paracoccus sp. (in: a-proteobacteria)]|tara:strand:- start:1910 stop:4714 length:2805 start_codon:yes stop_codon:yes gene_type:complete
MTSDAPAFGKGCNLHLIDGSAFIFRAYHALPPLTRKSDGLPVGAVAGFCNMLWKYVTDEHGSDAPTHAAVIFDHSAKTFRNEIYNAYKANRPDPPEDLRPQFPLTRDATRAFNIACIETEGYEADDIIAALACKARDAGGSVTIISSDKDLMQLVGDGVQMLDPIKGKPIGPDEVREKFGVGPDRVVDVQALAGDAVDNVPGAPGIGIKTAALLIQEYGDLETLLDRADEIKQPKRRQTLIENAEQIRISKRLVTLDCDTPLDFTLESLEVRDPHAETLLGFLSEMEFRTLTARVAERLGAEAPPVVSAPPSDVAAAPEMPAIDPASYETVTDMAALDRWIVAIREVGQVAIDTETTGLDEMRADLAGICLAVAPGQACYIPVGHVAGGDDLFGQSALVDGQLALDQVLAVLKPVLEDAAILKIGQNLKYDWKILARHGIRMDPIADTMLMSYALNAGTHNHGMDELAERYLGHKCIPIKGLIGSGKAQINFSQVPIDKAAPYAAEDADVTLRLFRHFAPMLPAQRVTTVYERLERPMVAVLGEMEMAGIRVDGDHLKRMSNAFAQKMAQLEEEIHDLAGQSFNVGSPKQLGEILFDKMGLAGGKQGKTGAYSTSADVLEDLAVEHDLPARILDWRQIAKLKSTYTDALQGHVNPETGRVHTSYSIAGAQTGRLASTDPNLQNIPVRTEEGRRIREAFIAAPGHRLVSLDYSQIELRILAHVADIPALKQAFRDGIDIHAMTASQMFGVPVEGMDPMIRRQAKAINFGVIYGISGFGLSRNLRIPRADAQSFIDTYFERFPEIRAYMDRTVTDAKSDGSVRTLFGRRINTPGINQTGPAAGGARRAAINAPIQGAAADIIRRAMIRMPDGIGHLPARMLLQVHDELVFEVEEGAIDDLIAAARTVMEGAAEPVIRLSVPLVVDAGHGATWAEAH